VYILDLRVRSDSEISYLETQHTLLCCLDVLLAHLHQLDLAQLQAGDYNFTLGTRQLLRQLCFSLLHFAPRGSASSDMVRMHPYWYCYCSSPPSCMHCSPALVGRAVCMHNSS
jgi:hypothetical protein